MLVQFKNQGFQNFKIKNLQIWVFKIEEFEIKVN